MRIITLNVNGIRSATSKGLFGWLGRQDADIVCVQEVRAQEGDLTDAMRAPKRLPRLFQLRGEKAMPA